MKALWRISIIAGTAVSAYFAGKYQSQVESASHVFEGPGIPVFPKLYAASILENRHFDPQDVLNLESKSHQADKSHHGGKDHNVGKNHKEKGTVSQVMKYGFPSLENVRSFEDFVLSYNCRNRIANWVFEHLTKEKVKFNKKINRDDYEFFEDKSIHPFFRSKNSDYKNSGYDRGHLAAAGNHGQSGKKCKQTFVLSNMAPQVGEGFNRDYWYQLEKYVRKLTKKNPNVYVCTGPLFLPKKESDGKFYVKYQVIGNNTVAVPTHFFKVVLIETNASTFEMEAYVLPNSPIKDETPLTKFLVPIESIERAAGILLFQSLPKEKLKKINGKTTN